MPLCQQAYFFRRTLQAWIFNFSVSVCECIYMILVDFYFFSSLLSQLSALFVRKPTLQQTTALPCLHEAVKCQSEILLSVNFKNVGQTSLIYLFFKL